MRNLVADASAETCAGVARRRARLLGGMAAW
jgi:hypothetical protein